MRWHWLAVALLVVGCSKDDPKAGGSQCESVQDCDCAGGACEGGWCVCEDDRDTAFDATSDASSTDAAATDGAVADAADASTDLGASDGESDMTDAADMPRQRGVCTDDADCPGQYDTCVVIGGDDSTGYHACQTDEVFEPGCGQINPPDQCCTHTDCNGNDPDAVCVTGPIFYCGGIAPVPANVCLTDECNLDSDCQDRQVCVPARVFGEPVARCVSAVCEIDADCDARSGGECRPFTDPCSNRFAGFWCTYDDSVCRTSRDCSNGEHCSPGMDGNTSCQVFEPPP